MTPTAPLLDRGADRGGTCVAEHLPPTADPPEPLRRVPFWRGLLLFWLHPRSLGPQLAAGSWRRALAAHIIAPLLAALFFADWMLPGTDAYFLETTTGIAAREWNSLRERLADFILDSATAATLTPVPWAVPLIMFAAIPAAELAILIAGAVLMPWAAAGDSGWSAWRRSVKLLYWSTTIVIPAAMLARVASALRLTQHYDSQVLDYLQPVWLVIWTLTFLLIFQYGRMLVLGLSRYVGSPDGPAFAPREPRCDDCGYLIIGLPLESKCPECALPVRESLLSGRRALPRWCEVELRPSGFLELLRLQVAVFTDHGWFGRVAVHSGLSAARHFWWGVCGMMLLVVAALFSASVHFYEELPGAELTRPIRVLAVFSAIVLHQSIVSGFAGHWAARKLGVADYRCAAIVCYYAAPLAWPAMLMLSMGVLTSEQGADALSQWLRSAVQRNVPAFPLTAVNPNAALEAAIWLMLWLGYAFGLIFWMNRLRRALAATQYANI